MITLFDVFQFALVLAGGIAGYHIGFASAGTVGGIAGAIAGLASGWLVGRLPFVVSFSLLCRSLKRASSSELRSRLDSQYFLSHLIIAELVRRGEPVESFREVVAVQLASESLDVRRFGQANAQVWFPELAGGPTASQPTAAADQGCEPGH